MITIIDYGLGNLGSIKNMFRKIGVDSVITSEIAEVEKATKIILPGVGAFDSGMRHLRAAGLEDILNHKALKEKIPVLGICLGAQLMTKSSEEGSEPGLGWFDAQSLKFSFEGLPGKWPLPNIGWRDVVPQNGYQLTKGIEGDPRFYFVHSYFMQSNDPAIVSLTTQYGADFCCGLHQDNLHCTQFHPEKSHRFGMQFLKNFAAL